MRGFVVCASLFLAGYSLQGFFARQARIYLLGYAEARMDELGCNLPEADEVEVLTLGQRDLDGTTGKELLEGRQITA